MLTLNLQSLFSSITFPEAEQFLAKYQVRLSLLFQLLKFGSHKKVAKPLYMCSDCKPPRPMPLTAGG